MSTSLHGTFNSCTLILTCIPSDFGVGVGLLLTWVSSEEDKWNLDFAESSASKRV